MPTYYESAEDIVISKSRAEEEVRKYAREAGLIPGDLWAEFQAEVGDRTEYEAQDVLGWLGH